MSVICIKHVRTQVVGCTCTLRIIL